MEGKYFNRQNFLGSRGFTLIELLTIISIIGFLGSVGMFSLVNTRNKAKTAKGLQFSQSVNNALGAYAVGIWGFDEASGTTVYDASGNGKDGIIYNGTNRTDDTPSGKGRALILSGSSNYVNIGIGANYFPMPLFSICAWVKSPGLAPGMTKNGIVSLTYGLIFELNGSGQFQTAIDNGTSILPLSVPGNLHDNQFHHLCLTFDGSYRHMYVDGTAKLKQATIWYGTTRWPTNNCTIGRNNNDAYYYFNGLIDDVRVYGESISQASIKKIYAEGIKRLELASNN